MQVKEFIKEFGGEVGIKDATTLYRYIWLNDKELENQGIIKIHRIFVREFIDILEPKKLVEFLNMIRDKKRAERREKYYKRTKYKNHQTETENELVTV